MSHSFIRPYVIIVVLNHHQHHHVAVICWLVATVVCGLGCGIGLVHAGCHDGLHVVCSMLPLCVQSVLGVLELELLSNLGNKVAFSWISF